MSLVHDNDRNQVFMTSKSTWNMDIFDRNRMHIIEDPDELSKEQISEWIINGSHGINPYIIKVSNRISSSDLSIISHWKDISDADLKYLTIYKKNLKELNLYNCKHVSDLSFVKKWNNLQSLNISWCNCVSDLSILSTCTALKELDLTGLDRITDVSKIKSRSLKILNLSYCTNIDQNSMRVLLATTCNAIEQIEMIGCRWVTDLTILEKCDHLQILNLMYCTNVSDLKPLNACKALHDFRYNGCGYKDKESDIQRIQAIPNDIMCEILITAGEWKDKEYNIINTAMSVCRSWRKLMLDFLKKTKKDEIGINRMKIGPSISAQTHFKVNPFVIEIVKQVSLQLSSCCSNQFNTFNILNYKLSVGDLEAIATLFRKNNVIFTSTGHKDQFYNVQFLQAVMNNQLTKMKYMLETQMVSTDCWNGRALLYAIWGAKSGFKEGHDGIEAVRLLLNRALNPNDQLVVEAVKSGNLALVKLLLEHLSAVSSRTTIYDIHPLSKALAKAAYFKHISIVRLLLDFPHHPPRADDGNALENAAAGGAKDIVQMLLNWPRHAPRADCQNGNALVKAVAFGHKSVVKLLLQWPTHAPRAKCQIAKALEIAKRGYNADHNAIVQLLIHEKRNMLIENLKELIDLPCI